MQSKQLVTVLNSKKLQHCVAIKFMSSANQVFANKLKQTSESEDVIVKPSRVVYSLNHYESISQYLDSKKCLQEVKAKIPPHFMLRKFSCPHSLYIVDEDVACNILKCLKPHLKSSKSHIVEVNAGIGVLTKQLLKEKWPRLRIYEADSTFYNNLHIAILKHHSDARLFKANLLRLWGMIRQDGDDNRNRVKAVLDGLPSLAWEDEPVVKIIAVIPSENFLLFMIHSVVHQQGVCEFGRPELFLVMQPFIYRKLTERPSGVHTKYLSKAVLFQLLFKHTILTTVPGNAILPWINKHKNQKTWKTNGEDNDMLLVKVTARKDLFKRISLHEIKPLWFFVKVLMQRRKGNLLGTIEEWLPGCGVRLIAKGYTTYTQCGALNPEQIFELFQVFVSWPEYESTSFVSAMESLLVKMTVPGLSEEISKSTNNYEKDKSDNVESASYITQDENFNDEHLVSQQEK